MKTRISLVALALPLTINAVAHAGGFYVGINGSRPTGRGGAFVARADDLTAVALNPAGLAKLDGLVHVGNRFSYNANIFERADTLDWGASDTMPPLVQFEPSRNQKPWQLLDPLIGASSRLGFEDLTFALASYAPAGVALQEFPIDGGQRFLMVKMEALMIHHTLNVAWRASDDLALGASLQWIFVPQLDYQLVIDGDAFAAQANPVGSGLDMLSTVSGSDPFTPNLVLGAWYRVAPKVELGLAGQVIPAQIETESTLSIDPVLPEQVPGGVEILRDGRPANDVQLKIPLPLSARAGIRYLLGDDGSDVEFDLKYETWSRAQRFSLVTNGLVASWNNNPVDVGTINIEKHWQDVIGVHLGSDLVVAPDALTVRAGAFYETEASPAAYSNVDALGGSQLGGAVGGSIFAGDLEIALAYEYRHFPEVSVSEADARVYQQVPGGTCEAPYTDPARCNSHYLGQPAPVVNAGSYRAYVHAMSVDFLYRF